ncbi:MAG: hypothetical protein A2X86_07755 [Bdellovibrionales bacterium GWA2_49_15]|nr:MAG: hypothetical protein A2X86_07755 [Bdellovibrionales bacterium GWA2_49_15]HAZ11827.1 hypothetical protein [Bdellovibrionales bacterium]
MSMKILFLGLSLLFCVSTMAREDIYGEAQIIGNVSQITKIVDGCSVKIATFSYYTPSGVHPLFQGEVMGQEIFLNIRQCAGMQVGDEISGVLVLNENGLTLED